MSNFLFLLVRVRALHAACIVYCTMYNSEYSIYFARILNDDVTKTVYIAPMLGSH